MPESAPTSARNQYERDGFLLVQSSLIPDELVERARSGMDRIRAGDYDTGRPPEASPWKPGDDPAALCKIEQPQFASRAVLDLVSCPQLGEWAAGITAASWVQAWWVQLLYKPTSSSKTGTSIGWHQDRHYWGAWEEGSELFTAWVAVSDVTAQAGPMRFVRGSHRWGLSEESNFFAQDIDGQRESFSVPAGEQWQEVPAILPSGGVSFHHCLTLHGSGPNLLPEPRRSFAIHLRTEKSKPLGDQRNGLTKFIDDERLCPVIYGR